MDLLVSNKPLPGQERMFSTSEVRSSWLAVLASHMLGHLRRSPGTNMQMLVTVVGDTMSAYPPFLP